MFKVNNKDTRTTPLVKSVLDFPQITNEDRAGLKTFHQQLKTVTTWLSSRQLLDFRDTSNTTFIETSKMQN